MAVLETMYSLSEEKPMARTTTPAEQDQREQVAQGLKLIDPETASKPIADAFALLPVINVFRAMANAETLYPYYSGYLLRLFQPMELDKALERMIEATDKTYDAAKKHSSDRALTEILYVIGTYMFIARVIRTGRVPLDDKPAASPQ
jgi:hypothetical protein